MDLILYDGGCGMCNAVVQFVLARDRAGQFQFAPLQGDTARRVLGKTPDVDSVMVVHSTSPAPVAPAEGRLIRTDAALYIAGHLGWPWRAAVIFRLVPRAVRDLIYIAVAKRRHRVPVRPAACVVPNPNQRGRFLP
jgi:predicted DCC family thiol-disulfide oxidoreductase YuxK